MTRIRFFQFVLGATFVAPLFLAEGHVMANAPIDEVHTYLSFGLPVDPARIVTMVDYDFSYALASTLVDWSDSKDPTSALAQSWIYSAEKQITFELKPNLKWSDGSILSAEDVAASFLRARSKYPEELKSLFNIVESIVASSPRSVVFNLNVKAGGSGIVKKLTEPMYGILSTDKSGGLNLARTSGPFFMVSATTKQVELQQNKNWFNRSKGMASKVVIRQLETVEDEQSHFLTDSWANILSTSSLTKSEIQQNFKAARFTAWNRNLDKAFFLSPGPKLHSEEGRKLMQAINSELDRKLLSRNLDGISEGDQLFVSGYKLFAPLFQKKLKNKVISETHRTIPLEILVIRSRIDEVLKSNIASAIMKATGLLPNFRTVSLAELGEARKLKNYDFLAASITVDDANLEGLIGYIFDQSPPVIPNAGATPELNYQLRVQRAKLNHDETGRSQEYRKIFESAINEGCIVPLFHYSTLVVAKPGIDLTKVPQSDETVAFAKVRFQ